MLDKLIAEGEALKSEAEDGMMGKILSGENFEKWATKCLMYLEQNHLNTSMTERAKTVYKNINNNSYENYEFLLGSLKGIKDY